MPTESYSNRAVLRLQQSEARTARKASELATGYVPALEIKKMDTGKTYHDSDGNECSIWQVVRREPDWAASRAQEGEKALAKIEKLKSAFCDLIGESTEPDAFGNVAVPSIDLEAFRKELSST